MFKRREFDYYYMVLIRNPENEVIYVNSEKHWSNSEGKITITRLDLANTPLMIHQQEVAEAIARRINGEVRRIEIGEQIDVDL